MKHPSKGAMIRPAERDRGCVWKDDFRSQANMVASGWTLFNTPTFDARGMILDGVNQYGSIPVQGEFNNTELTIHIEFYPDFATDEDVVRYIYSSKDVARDYSLFKLKNDNANILFVTMGGVNITSIPEATYSPYWIVGGRNVITISSTSTDTNIWLNTGAILVGAAQAWSPKQQTMLYAGSSITGGNKYDGTISRLYIGHHTSDLAEHTAVYNNTMWSYQNRAVVDLQFRTADYDIANVRTLDSSGNGNHATLGDGSTPATYMTQGAGRMEADGAQYLQIPADASIPAGAYTVLMAVKPGAASSKYIWDARHTGGTGYFWIDGTTEYAFPSGSLFVDGVGPYATSTFTVIDKITTLVLAGPTVDVANILAVISSQGLAGGIVGTLFDFKVVPGTLNQTQILDYHSNVMRRLGAEV